MVLPLSVVMLSQKYGGDNEWVEPRDNSSLTPREWVKCYPPEHLVLTSSDNVLAHGVNVHVIDSCLANNMVGHGEARVRVLEK